jgi:hypothetical protein
MSTTANQRKLDIVQEPALLAERFGMTMIEIALALAISYPASPSAIIDPRAIEQLESQLPAEADDACLDSGATSYGLSTVDGLSTNLSTNQGHLVPLVQLWSRGLTLRSLPAERAPV